jgi:hypothetical protein
MTNTHVKALVDGMAELGKDGPTPKLDLRSQKRITGGDVHAENI